MNLIHLWKWNVWSIHAKTNSIMKFLQEQEIIMHRIYICSKLIQFIIIVAHEWFDHRSIDRPVNKITGWIMVYFLIIFFHLKSPLLLDHNNTSSLPAPKWSYKWVTYCDHLLYFQIKKISSFTDELFVLLLGISINNLCCYCCCNFMYCYFRWYFFLLPAGYCDICVIIINTKVIRLMSDSLKLFYWICFSERIPKWLHM